MIPFRSLRPFVALAGVLAGLLGLLPGKAAPTLTITGAAGGPLTVLANPDATAPGASVVIQQSGDLTHWISIAGAAPAPLEVTVPASKAMFFRALTISQQPATPFAITVSNLTAYVAPGNLVWADGTVSPFAGGSVGLFDNLTNYIVLNLATMRLHALVRHIGDDSVLLSVVTFTNGAVQVMTQPSSIAPPPTRIGAFKAKMAAGQPCQIAEIGDSLTQGAGSGVMWWDLLFNPAQSSFGMNLPNASEVSQVNYALGGSSAEYALTLLGPCVWNENSAITAWQLLGFDFDDYYDIGDPSFPFASAGPSNFASSQPDLVTFGYGNNTSPYQYIAIESCLREFVAKGWQTVLLTGNGNSNVLTAGMEIGENLARLRAAYGFPIADTWAYVDEINRRGTNTYFDSVHQTQAGWLAWAECVSGVLNPSSQDPVPQALPAERVLGVSNPAEAASQFSAAEYVFVPCDSLNATRVSNPGLLPTLVPAVFNLPQNKIAFNVSTGGYVTFTDDAWSAASLFIERGLGTNSFQADVSWIDCGAGLHSIGSISFTDSSFGAGTLALLPLATISQTLPAITNLIYGCGDSWLPNYNNGGLRITVTNGNAIILGCVFFGPKKTSYRFEDFSASGGWGIEAPDPFGIASKIFYTDTLDDYAFIQFHGRALMMIFRTSVAGGAFDAFLDQTQILYGFSTHASGGYASKPMLLQLPIAGPASTSEEHSLLIRLSGTVAGAASPTNGLHRLSILKAASFE